MGHQKHACYVCPATACRPAPRRCPRTLKTSPNKRGNPAIDVSLQKGLPRWKSSTSLVAVKPAVCDVAELKFLPCSAGSFFFFIASLEIQSLLRLSGICCRTGSFSFCFCGDLGWLVSEREVFSPSVRCSSVVPARYNLVLRNSCILALLQSSATQLLHRRFVLAFKQSSHASLSEG